MVQMSGIRQHKIEDVLRAMEDQSPLGKAYKIWDGPKPNAPAYIAVPESVAHEILARVDAAVITYPELAPERQEMQKALFGVFAEHGHLNCEILPQISTESESQEG